MTMRDEQRVATRARILDVAVELLIDQGYSAMTTVAVQNAAAMSRGALLHHFPTMRALSEAMVEHVVLGNEAVVRESVSHLPATLDPVSRAVSALYEALSRPAFHAELELWSAARTDPQLRAGLRRAERRAGRDLDRVLDDLFGVPATAHPNYRVVADMTVMLVRGLAVSHPLHSNDRAARRLIEQWSVLAAELLRTDTSPAPACP